MLLIQKVHKIPAVFIESEDSNNENATTGIDSWFEKIFDSM